jgi:hypothetical protein
MNQTHQMTYGILSNRRGALRVAFVQRFNNILEYENPMSQMNCAILQEFKMEELLAGVVQLHHKKTNGPLWILSACHRCRS